MIYKISKDESFIDFFDLGTQNFRIFKLSIICHIFKNNNIA